MTKRTHKLTPGEPAPWFRAPALGGSSTYAFDTVAGRHVLLLLFGTAKFEPCKRALELVQANRELFNDDKACFFGVTTQPEDAQSGAIAQQLPGIRYFLDHEGAVSRLYGALDGTDYQPHWLLLDPMLRVIGRYELDQGANAIEALRSSIARSIPDDSWAPVLVAPNVFEPDFCRRLIDAYERDGGAESGFMRDVGGKTVLIVDPAHKQRRDYEISEADLRQQIAARIRMRLKPMVERAFQFEATRIERYLVACYSQGAGHFRPHRDNTTKGTAHRRFAVTINLNPDEYDGGDLRFPEFGRRTYRAPLGGAIVFSCSLLHEATPMLRGKRYAFLPFLYDEAAAQVREENDQFLAGGLGGYKK